MRWLELLAAALLCGVPAAAQAGERAEIASAIDTQYDKLADIAGKIWRYAELGFQEERSSRLLQQELAANGFEVDAAVAGMPTAFVARWQNGHGAVIGLLAEYDALPGLSQAAASRREAAGGMSSGHGCGHNLFGAASVTAAIALRQWMIRHDVHGEIRVFGTPAEEGGSGKVFMVRAGLFRDVDAVIHWHPGDVSSASQGHWLANISGKFVFTGTAAHAAMAPDRGRSALDGVEALNMMVNLMREHVPQDARIHYVITDGGKAPNVVPGRAEAYYYIRHPDKDVASQIFERIRKAANGAALGTGTTVSFDQIGGTYDLLPNDTLGRVADRALRALPAIAYEPAEQAFIKEIQSTFPDRPKAADAAMPPYSSGELVYASTDVGDVSYTVPTVGIVIGTWPRGTALHSWQAVAASGGTVGYKGALLAAKVMALTAVELFQRPGLLAKAKAELATRRGAEFTYAPLLKTDNPRLDYRQ